MPRASRRADMHALEGEERAQRAPVLAGPGRREETEDDVVRVHGAGVRDLAGWKVRG